MSRDRAAYMREYRAKKKEWARVNLDPYATPAMMRRADADAAQIHETIKELAARTDRIAELEEEVHHLKAELAKRPHMGEIKRRPKVWIEDSSYSTRPFTPVPKHK